jgi:hypothetical protein
MSWPHHRAGGLLGRWGLSLAWLVVGLLASLSAWGADPLVPAGWDAKAAGDATMEGLLVVTAPQVKGAHDSSLVIQGRRAFIVYMANDERPGETPAWPFIYVALSVVDIDRMQVEKIIPCVRGGQEFANATLPPGACFVPRIMKLNDRTLRCFFASEEPGQRSSQTWYIDFDTERLAFHDTIHRAKIKTAAGTFPMQPEVLHADAVRLGFPHPVKDHGLYMIDGFKEIDGEMYAVLNGFTARHNALARVNATRDTFEVLGHYNEPGELTLSESSVQKLPDGTWLAIARQEGGNRNYTFTTSADGRTWTPNVHRELVPNGTSSKPTFDRFGGVYYLGWQESTRIDRVNRSVFNIEVSRDGQNWERKYRFETPKSFQYPTFVEHEGVIYFSVTQGESDPSRKERILFGRLR